MAQNMFWLSRKAAVWRRRSRTMVVSYVAVRCSSWPLSIEFGGWPRSICIVRACMKKYCTSVSIRLRVGMCAATCLSIDCIPAELGDMRHL